jgi:SAM-dependent methyltransferase
MSELNNQKDYWNKVAGSKTFTHPIDMDILTGFFQKDFTILDYGCGYGRLAEELYTNGFVHITGVDTSSALIKRGKALFPGLNLICINNIHELNDFENDFDAVILFAVLTCIPSNAGQKEIIGILQNRLKKGGLLYISDYYLQESTDEVKEYNSLNDDPDNYGVFSLPEGVVFRHHTKEWIKELVQDFEIVSERILPVKTMNGHIAEAFQILARK